MAIAKSKHASFLKPRSAGASSATTLGDENPRCSNNIGALSRALQRIGRRDARQSRRAVDGISKKRKTKPRTIVLNNTSNVSSDQMQHMLGMVDDMLHSKETIFSSVACNDRMFLKHNSGTLLGGYSRAQSVRILIEVQEALQVLSECRQQWGDDWLLQQSGYAGIDIDDKFIANYEHMLLRLCSELIKFIARKALEELLDGGHDKNQRKLLNYFTEYSDNHRPLRTSFPWTIKPSLAVLWGVCWMFYNNRVGQDRILEQVATEIQWSPPASSDYMDYGLTMISTPLQHQTQRQTQHQTRHQTQHQTQHQPDEALQARNSQGFSPAPTPGEFRLPSAQDSQAEAHGLVPPLHSPAAAPLPSKSSAKSTCYHPPHTQHDFDMPFAQPSYLPYIQTSIPLSAYTELGSDNTANITTNAWHPYISSPQYRLRHQLTSQQPPSIRVTGTAEDNFFAQPHQQLAACSSIYLYTGQPEASLRDQNLYFNFVDNQNMNMSSSNLLLDSTITQSVHTPVKHEHTCSANSATNISTSVSIPEPLSPLVSPTTAGPKLKTTTSCHSRHDSVESSEREIDEDGNRKNYGYKRAEEPLRNQDGKMICINQECTGLLFDRKCEWSKHMDKHDRPYKCTVKGCEKLQGFTYSGGLLRHEREVHKMHGGTKQSLYCPFSDCKRSSGSGFTRKENLTEHIRRVHRQTSMSADMHGLVIRRTSSPAIELQVTAESPNHRQMELCEEDELNLKRKREADPEWSDRGSDDMRGEIKRLRQENEEKDLRLRMLEQAVMALQQSHR